jgi:hypothetical protein
MQRHLWTGTDRQPPCANKAQPYKSGIDFGLGSRARMKSCFYAGILEQRPQLSGLAVPPLMKEASARLEL